VALIAALVFMASGFSCSKKAAVVSRDAAVAVRAFQTVEIQLHKDGRISDTEHRLIQQYLKAVGRSGMAIDAAIGQERAVAAVDAAITSVNDMIQQGIVPLHDEQVSAQLKLAAQAIVLAFNQIKVAL
ncbi:MAG TPA: hypothetical protein VLT85_12045, partial [Terriglobales bacterium]|nr:hypothetical protein [Terriglobales bacterium]